MGQTAHEGGAKARRCWVGINQKGTRHMLTTFEFVATWMRSKANTERGASLVEYALLLALIAVVCIVAVTALGKKASGNFSQIDSNLN
jgi:pilus assembly protein Flp/PilA